MATVYWIERSAFGNFINFTDQDAGGHETVATDSQIEIEYTGKPTTLGLSDSIDEDVASLVMWDVLKDLYTLRGNRIAFSLAHDNYKSQKVLVNKLKNLHSSGMTVRAYDY